LLVGVFCLLGAVVFFSLDKSADELAQLNLKYGLVAVESLDESVAPRVANLFAPDFLRANLLDSDTPQKELIVKLAGKDSKNLADVLILDLRTDADIAQVAAEYSNSEMVEFAEPNFELSTELSPVTIAELPAELEISAPAGESVLVAVLDSGVDVAHPAIVGRVVIGRNFLDDSTDVSDAEGHGTHIAGIILANSDSAEILPLKIFDGSSGKIRELVAAIKFATDRSARIINLGLGLKKESQILREAIEYARAKDVFVVAAAGNYRSDSEYFPAAWSNVFAVSALRKNGAKLFLSNFGEWVDFSVVAQDVRAPMPGGGYSLRTGTSQASPVVSAKIADFLSTSNLTDFVAVENFLLENSEPISGKYLLGRQIFVGGE